jgi:hypothetical protein
MFSHVPAQLANPCTHISDETGEIRLHTGNAKNISVAITPRRLYVEGSLCKFYKGNNIETLTRQETAGALAMLADHLHVPITDAIVTRLDVGINVETTHAPAEYFRLLGHSKRYLIRTYQDGDRAPDTPQTLYYYTGQNHKRARRVLAFYDKIEETKYRKGYVPEKYAEKNILRFELRHMKKLQEQFAPVQQIHAGMLTEHGFREQLLQQLNDEYQSIQKHNYLNGQQIMALFHNTREFQKYAAHCLCANMGGAAQFELWLRQQQKLNAALGNVQIGRIIKYATEPIEEDESEMVKEFDATVRAEIERLREDNNAAE